MNTFAELVQCMYKRLQPTIMCDFVFMTIQATQLKGGNKNHTRMHNLKTLIDGQTLKMDHQTFFNM